MLKQLLRTVTGDAASDAGKGTGRLRSSLGYGSEGPGTESAETDVDEHLRLHPPEERVLSLLEEHGGRMWQGDVVTVTGYSVGRVSQLLTEMEADGRIARYWKDGSKVVVLPETGVEETPE